MPFMIVRQTVQDFEKWDEAFHSAMRDLQAAGQRGFHIFLNVDDPHQVTAIYEMENLDKAREIARQEVADTDVQNQAGIMGVPEISFFDEIECSGSLCGM